MSEQAQSQTPTDFRRFSASQRFEHMALIVSFVGLALTGLPQSYASHEWAQELINFMGGVESVRIIHRTLAIILMAEAIYHGGVIGYKLYVLRGRASMLPGTRDIRDLRDWFLFNLGLTAKHPRLPRYHFGEKAEYLATVCGTAIMILTGLILWNPIATARLMPGETIPAARLAHSSQALLAVLVVATWHVYNVHLKRFNQSMFTGKLSREAMEEEHAEELETIESRTEEAVHSPQIIHRRNQRFRLIATLITIVLVGGLLWFITFEKTAIATVPRQEIQVFAPDLIPVEGDAAVGVALWPTLRCAMCHGDEATGLLDAPAVRGTDLTFDQFYLQVREGGDGMPAFGPGEIPDAYLLHLWRWLTDGSET